MGASVLREDPGGSAGSRGVSREEHLRESKTINEESRAEILYLASEIIRCGWRVDTYLPLRSRFHTRPPIFLGKGPGAEVGFHTENSGRAF